MVKLTPEARRRIGGAMPRVRPPGRHPMRASAAEAPPPRMVDDAQFELFLARAQRAAVERGDDVTEMVLRALDDRLRQMLGDPPFAGAQPGDEPWPRVMVDRMDDRPPVGWWVERFFGTEPGTDEEHPPNE